MTAIRRTSKTGFTLVEILIVVIILGILAAIVIPQFTNASTDARENSTRSLLQTIRSQIELYKLQHGDNWPTDDGLVDGAWTWTELTGQSSYNGITYGPYLQSTPKNPLNGFSAVAAAPAAATGWVFNDATQKFSATAADPTAAFAE